MGTMTGFIHGLTSLAPNLQSVVFLGGTRGYGVYQPRGNFNASLDEFFVNAVPHTYAKTVAYPLFRALLEAGCQCR